ncbi:uncharacterized protein LOC130649501 [Hydractinia symbiolongicarpus]|uniref:uncharacterized protein LOC130649501 n=1 Tax=Hydractinia symbiolongicarpus TaxID=13093 RepID=UPI00254B23AF|nr:uncharacterized protein LOC130649501 [Hydractinia symbiolongicarpus]
MHERILLLFIIVMLLSNATRQLQMKVKRQKSGFDMLFLMSTSPKICRTYNAEFVQQKNGYVTCLCNEPIFYSLHAYDVPKCHKFNGANIGCSCKTTCVSFITEKDTIMEWFVLSDAFSCSNIMGSYQLYEWDGQTWTKVNRKDFELVFEKVVDPVTKQVNKTSYYFKWRHTDRTTAMLYYQGRIFKVNVFCGKKSFGCHVGKAVGTKTYKILSERELITTTSTSKSKSTTTQTSRSLKSSKDNNNDGINTAVYITLSLIFVLIIVIICVTAFVLLKRKRKCSQGVVQNNVTTSPAPPSYTNNEFGIEDFIENERKHPMPPLPRRAPQPPPRDVIYSNTKES